MGSCCSTSKGMGKRIDTVELSTVDSADDASPKTKNSSKRWKKKKTGGDQVGCKDLVHEIDTPGRLIANGGSKVACLYTQQGKKGTNQDAMLVWENFSTRNDTIFCGVFDGHGPFGHMVAKKVRDSLPLILRTQWKANSNSELSNLGTTEYANGNSNIEETASPSIDDEWCEPLEVQENEKLPDMYLPLKRSFLKAFRLMDKELKLHPTIDCLCSGTTAVTLVKQGQNLVLGNVGDSRAVLATRDKDNSLIAVQLTVDLKPDLPAESARIHQCKGRVFALQDEPEVARVWLPNNDSPGLAMARAFGDFCLKDFGLISVPDVYYRQLTERDEFIILATDGVWDVLSNKEAIEIVASAPGHTTAARALVDCAVRAWRLKYPTSKNDDCAVVCLFLEQLSVAAEAVTENDVSKINGEAMERMAITDEKTEDLEISDSHAVLLEHSGTVRSSNEIVPIFESTEQKLPTKFEGQSKRSLAECISTTEDEDWSALEGVTRVNSLLSLPRLLSGDKRAASWRKKWL
ncbi:unnamed protein product [Prunus armeniaca]|uniref:protein-serine/threonine phosphatase n=1 Tax=Prunus armeniaca TaxID=36596 RepID=A0A6J5XF04_PRUAR|nr:unnamed protein product [Prunus armeniaca]CAB4312299.1 unnamed protein product [Prunus armeniaca]